MESNAPPAGSTSAPSTAATDRLGYLADDRLGLSQRAGRFHVLPGFRFDQQRDELVLVLRLDGEDMRECHETAALRDGRHAAFLYEKLLSSMEGSCCLSAVSATTPHDLSNGSVLLSGTVTGLALQTRQAHGSRAMVNYQERLNRVVAHIHEHLDDELDLNRLADVACLSPYHWHRIYQAVYGETLAATVKRQRLHRAAGYLAHSSMPVEEVAERSGYPNVQSFTRIFRSVFGMPPARYRKEGSHTRFQTRGREETQIMYTVEIKTIPATRAIGVDHAGSYMQIAKAFDTLYGWLITHGHIGSVTRSIGLYLDDSTAVPENELRSKACVIMSENIPIAPPLARVELSQGRYAVLRHTGPYADMKAAYEWLYGVWLVQSGLEAADAPVFEEYLNSPRDTAPTDLITDIYLPLHHQSADS